MRRILTVAAVLAAAAAAVPGLQPAARAGTECNGLLVCIPVAGPWVKIRPQSGSHRVATLYQLSCPMSSVIGGLDAEVTHRSIDVSFAGSLGGPVSPGVTTRTAAVFAATETGRRPLPTAFRPLLGCIPGGGGGRGRTSRPPARSLTSALAAPSAAPGEPTVLRVRSFPVRSGRPTVVSYGCRPDERLVSSAHAIAFHTRRAPSARQLSEVESAATVRGRRIRVRARADAAVSALRVSVQIQAVCARPNP
ncbi:MAG: hypothetical protein H0U07_09525 [Actinobacteria bacterium]|nr:hypothetical protein [Actinomycetota bacterium]